MSRAQSALPNLFRPGSSTTMMSPLLATHQLAQPPATPSSASSTSIPTHNSKGGIYVSPADVHSAFSFLDPDHTGVITAESILERLRIFYPNLTEKDCEFLMNGQTSFSEAKLFELVSSNQLTNFDPMAEAFKVFDPHRTGFAEVDTLRSILAQFGYKDLARADLMGLIHLVDRDGDGKINLADFKKLMQMPNTSANNQTNNPSISAANSPMLGGRRRLATPQHHLS